MPIEKTKLNILNRVIDFGADTEKKHGQENVLLKWQIF